MTTKKYLVIIYAFVFMCLSAYPALAAGSIMLKVVAVNPSKQLPQKVQVRAFLPKETKPEDILDRADLELTYDTQQGCYMVFNEYELKPAESLERTIEIRDIWLISESEITSLLSEADKISGLLKGTEFEDRSNYLLSSIQSKLKQIDENQKNPAPNPERHISDYRDNVKLMDSVKSDLSMIRSLLSLAKPLPSIVVWRAVVFIMIFLGVIGAGFFFIWQKKLKTVLTEDTFYVPPQSGQDKPKS